MTKIQRKRLFRLARHLEKGKRFHRKFDFSHVCSLDTDKHGNLCGTAGCALGECPAAFPKHWRFEQEQSFDYSEIFDRVRLRRNTQDDVFSDAQIFFGLYQDEAQHLFHPHHQNTQFYGGVCLGNGATAKQVARNIRAFLKIKARQRS